MRSSLTQKQILQLIALFLPLVTGGLAWWVWGPLLPVIIGVILGGIISGVLERLAKKL